MYIKDLRGNKTMAFVITTIVCFIAYLFLTTGSTTDEGINIWLWSLEEILLGIILSLFAGFVSRNIFVKKDLRMLNPLRWILFLVYVIGPFFVGMAIANLDVAYRVITGKINPGIVQISPGLKTDLGITMLANSITLTPGTLSVDIDEKKNDLYVHWINVKEDATRKKPVDCKYICRNFHDWIRRIAE